MRLWGHPIHPALVHFPVAFWTVAAAAYIADAAGVEGAAAVAKFSNGAGLIMALLAMTAGVMELRLIDSRSAAMRVATSHMMAMAAAWVSFMVALVITNSTGASLDKQIAQLAGVASASLGFLLMSVGGWLGGRLVYEFGIGMGAREKT
jgi:uncharacterized membrane protein